MRTMKKFIYIALALTMFTAFYSCKDQDEIYKQWVKPGGYIYPEKTNGLKGYSGNNRIMLKWAYPKDPSVVKAKIYWATRTDSMELDYKDYAGQDTIRLYISSLEERSYSFEIFNYDAEGHVSMGSQAIVAPYSNIWLSLHSEREIKSAQINSGTDATITIGYGTDEMVATRFRYYNTAGDLVLLDQTADIYTTTVTFPNAAPGRRFEYASSYVPGNGLDTVWNGWRKSVLPIAGKLDCSSWVAESNATNDRPTSNLFDGVIGGDINHAWWAKTGAFPKILVIDNQKDSYFLNKLVLYQNTSGGFAYRTNQKVKLYISDKPFNKNAAFDLSALTSSDETFKRAKGEWATTFWNGTAYWSCSLNNMYNVRYIAIVFFDSRRNGNALFEVEAYGYDSASE